jgi:hypothetical protein
MTLFEILTNPQTGLGLPCAYSHFRDDEVPEAPPYLVYIGNGQDNLDADNTFYWRRNRYQIEYYFTLKDEDQEKAIEDLLLENGYLYEKSEDVYIEEQGVFVIYYNV